MSPSRRERSHKADRFRLGVVVSTQPARFQAATFQGDLRQSLARVAALGYAGVELAVRAPSLIDVDGLSALLEEFGLAAPALGTGQAWAEEGLSFTDPDPLVRRAAVARMEAQVQLAARLGALVIVGLIRGTVFPAVAPDQAWSWLVQALRELCDTADRYQVRLALEPINRYETALVNDVAAGLALLAEVGAPCLGLLLDTFHMNIEEASIEESITRAGARIFHFHVADSNRRPPGAGHLDFRSILIALERTGYTGFVSGEFLPLPDAGSAAERAIAHLREVA